MRRVISLVVLCAAVAISVKFSDGQLLGGRLRDRIAQKRGSQQAQPNLDAVNPRGATSCDGRLNVGYRIVQFSSGLRAALWYPTTKAEEAYGYSVSLATSIAKDAPIANCEQRYPVAVFSHGFGGCGTQSAFFTEKLAREGFIVVAPDHKDSQCKVDQPRGRYQFKRAEEPFRKPGQWSDANYTDRRDDIKLILDELPKLPELAGRADMNRVAGVGHSMGGYTMMGLAGGWDSWRDKRLKAILLFSPYSKPYLVHGRLGSIRIPVMYEGGTRDFGVTPDIRKKGGIYEQSNSPKFYLEIEKAGHLDWSVRVCGEGATTDSCLGNAKAQLITEAGVQFLERYVAGTGKVPTVAVGGDVVDFRSAP